MTNPKISIICAVTKETRAIGINNKLIFWLSEDLKLFNKITSNHPVIMGRKTYESIGKPLPERLNIILTHDNIDTKEALVARSLEEAYSKAKKADVEEIFIIGGESVYKQSIKDADRLYLTIIDCESNTADAFFPDYSEFKRVIDDKKTEIDGIKVNYITLER